MERKLIEIIENNKDFYKYGKVADYIPALKNTNIKDCGLTVIDKEMNIYSVGDYSKKFTMQSISKVVALMQAILDNGIDRVFQTVGYEGSEKSFNAISYLGEECTSKAINPMMNSGAIAVTSLVDGVGEEKFDRVLSLVRILSRNPNIDYNREVYLSEKSTGDRNRAIYYIMKSRGIIEDIEELVLDTYFKQCSISVDTVDLANIGMSISNRFENIELDKNVDKEGLSKLLVAIMTHSGMYNFSGEWSVNVGIPSKSGVAGGILSIIPNKYGIGFFGPSLDRKGNPLVGYKVLKDLSKELNISIY